IVILLPRIFGEKSITSCF
ncbi:hypothetical protein EE612_053325, partial [Oryza sativa]